MISPKTEIDETYDESNYTEKRLTSNMMYELADEQFKGNKDQETYDFTIFKHNLYSNRIQEEKSIKNLKEETILQLIFQKIDADNSGYIDFHELGNFLVLFAKETNRPVPNKDMIQMLYTILDTNEDGKISYNEIKGILREIVKILNNTFGQEYQVYLYEQMLMDENKLKGILKTIFEKYDTDNSGLISKNELYEMIKSISVEFDAQAPSEEEILSIIQEYDKNDDNSLSFKEMKNFLYIIL